MLQRSLGSPQAVRGSCRLICRASLRTHASSRGISSGTSRLRPQQQPASARRCMVVWAGRNEPLPFALSPPQRRLKFPWDSRLIAGRPGDIQVEVDMLQVRAAWQSDRHALQSITQLTRQQAHQSTAHNSAGDKHSRPHVRLPTPQRTTTPLTTTWPYYSSPCLLIQYPHLSFPLLVVAPPLPAFANTHRRAAPVACPTPRWKPCSIPWSHIARPLCGWP